MYPPPPFGRLFCMTTPFPAESVYLTSVSTYTLFFVGEVCPNAVRQIVNIVSVINSLIKFVTHVGLKVRA